MSGTRRVPLDRRPAVQITPRVLELFAELERARRARRRAVDCTIAESGYCTTNCRACRRWFDLHDRLHVALHLPLWTWPCLPRNPYPPGSPKARDRRPGAEQEDLWILLNEARRATVVASRRTASSSQAQEEDTYVAEPVIGEDA